jgi:hypothetical protein
MSRDRASSAAGVTSRPAGVGGHHRALAQVGQRLQHQLGAGRQAFDDHVARQRVGQFQRQRRARRKPGQRDAAKGQRRGAPQLEAAAGERGHASGTGQDEATPPQVRQRH